MHDFFGKKFAMRLNCNAKIFFCKRKIALAKEFFFGTMNESGGNGLTFFSREITMGQVAETSSAGWLIEENQEAVTGVKSQNGESTKGTILFNADETKKFGPTQVWIGKIKQTADVAYDAAGAVFDILGTKPTLAKRYRVVNVAVRVVSFRTGGTPDHDVKVQLGDGAASEAFADIAPTIDIDGFTVGTLTSIPVTGNEVITTGKTLRLQFQISGSTTTGTAEIEFHITVIPEIAKSDGTGS